MGIIFVSGGHGCFRIENNLTFLEKKNFRRLGPPMLFLGPSLTIIIVKNFRQVINITTYKTLLSYVCLTD